jgi:diguanylate cyclase (GGDEF)-like protein
LISNEESARLRERLMEVLAEDAHNTQRLVARLEAISRESGVGAHAALLLILTHLAFEEQEARQHWTAILAHQEQLASALGREPGVRMAVLDYFMNINRQLVQPTLIEIEMLESTGLDTARDRVTGLVTDRTFRTSLQHELRRARRYHQRASVVVFDLDDFAEINRRVGALVGDRLLREAAILLVNNIRDIDVAGRPGEDELALLLPETDRNAALLVADRFRRELESFFSRRQSAGGPVGLTVSAGVAGYPDDATAPETLLQHAAQALYEAKAAGKNGIQLYRPERRRYLRFELEPGRFEIEVLAAADRTAGQLRNYSRSGILFVAPESLEVGEEIEIRLADPGDDPEGRRLRIHGRVVRLEELPLPLGAASPEEREVVEPDRFEIGVAFDQEWTEGTDDLVKFLELAQGQRMGH